jgi:hypothetical protein
MVEGGEVVEGGTVVERGMLVAAWEVQGGVVQVVFLLQDSWEKRASLKSRLEGSRILGQNSWERGLLVFVWASLLGGIGYSRPSPWLTCWKWWPMLAVLLAEKGKGDLLSLPIR